ncbi:Uncharacterised protein [Klebsiella michiganensis]|uniref:Uncharacterized protein n=1 Tax=Klebsiella michiganensis TaxID=1134687 RepID=A0A7H4MYJ3_9ENTR|nr:hypothetical protein [Klebsiella michiganensis]MBZ6645625.1 hypothetical protein [Klebsiella michiganensis]MBZ7243250.1 hypothetical protein [Klebsiella michiganensis]MBZ7302398.1 hypothetical protein [Klebsiella michiganensis]MBZ7354210.1 hypothetical protein [Klebsiella michiganensis]
MAASPRLALRLAGLQVYSSLLARSPGKALCAAPGELTTGRIGYDFPEAMLRICPGYRSHTAMDP